MILNSISIFDLKWRLDIKADINMAIRDSDWVQSTISIFDMKMHTNQRLLNMTNSWNQPSIAILSYSKINVYNYISH